MISHEVPTMTEDGHSANAATSFRPATSRRRGRPPIYASIQDRRDANNARRREIRQNQRAVANATMPNSTSISVTTTINHVPNVAGLTSSIMDNHAYNTSETQLLRSDYIHILIGTVMTQSSRPQTSATNYNRNRSAIPPGATLHSYYKPSQPSLVSYINVKFTTNRFIEKSRQSTSCNASTCSNPISTEKHTSSTT